MRIFKNNTEITKEIGRLDSTVYALSYTISDHIYISSDLPFNHLFIKLGTTKSVASAVMKVEYSNGNWIESVELRDDTLGLSQDGFIEFTPNRNHGWSKALDSSQVGLTKVVYDKYWMRISFDKALTADISYIGHKFSDDTDLFSEYPIFDDANFMTAFKSGKTSWEEQHIKASDIIINDLIKKRIIISTEQILNRGKFITASVCKVAEIIFTSFGNDYDGGRKLANEEYLKRMDMSQYDVDTNANASLEIGEIASSQGWVNR